MKAPQSRSGGSQAPEQIVFVRGFPPLATFFLVVPSLIAVFVAINLLTRSMPITLVMLLALVGGVSLAWVKTALENIGDITLELDQQELKIKRLLGGVSYSWSDISLVKLVNPGASLGDMGRDDEGRVGIGLYLRKSRQDTPNPELPPDVIVHSGGADAAEAIIKASERVIAFHKRGNGSDRPTGTFGKTGKTFRRPAKAAATKAA